MTAKQNSLDPEIMSQFHGSEHWYNHGLGPTILYADGANMSPTPREPIPSS